MNQYRVNNYSILSSSATSSLFVSSGSVSLRKKKVSRPTWKTLSLSRKNKLKEEESGPAAGDLFKSPSIYGNRDNIGGGEAPSVMSSYLSGKPKIRRFNTQTTVSNLFQVFQWDFFFQAKYVPWHRLNSRQTSHIWSKESWRRNWNPRITRNNNKGRLSAMTKTMMTSTTRTSRTLWCRPTCSSPIQSRMAAAEFAPLCKVDHFLEWGKKSFHTYL